MNNKTSTSRKQAPAVLTSAPELDSEALAKLNAFRQAEHTSQYPPTGLGGAQEVSEYCEEKRKEAKRHALALARILSDLADQ